MEVTLTLYVTVRGGLATQTQTEQADTVQFKDFIVHK